MISEPTPGEQAELKYVVQEQDTAAALIRISGDRFPAVLSTTHCIALLELASGRILIRHQSPGELSVGVTVEVTHRAATPVGAEVVAHATYRGREGTLFVFDIVARDPGGEVMRGVHKRAVIEEARLLAGAAKRR